MEIFIDSGDTKEIKEAQAMGLVDGVTTNPTLAAKSGKPFKELILEICQIVDGPISAEVTTLTADEIDYRPLERASTVGQASSYR